MPQRTWASLYLMFLLAFVALACITPQGEEVGLSSASIRVIGESFMGLQFTKEVSLSRQGTGYLLRYSCQTEGGFEGFCPCTAVEKEVGSGTIDRFLAAVKALEDEGEEAKCCDHPWTEIELAYLDGRRERIIVAFEPVDVEGMFALRCQP